MALVRIFTATLTLLSIIACKDAVVITPDPIRSYGASVTVKLGDSSPLQSGFYRIQLLRADGSSDERFPEIRELDYVGGEQTFVLAVDENVFENANAIQARLYVEAFVGDEQIRSGWKSEYYTHKRRGHRDLTDTDLSTGTCQQSDREA